MSPSLLDFLRHILHECEVCGEEVKRSASRAQGPGAETLRRCITLPSMNKLPSVLLMSVALNCLPACTMLRRPDPGLEHTWYSPDSKACLTIARKGYSMLDELQRVRIKQTNSELAVFVFHGDLGFRPFCDRFNFHIESYSDSLLVLTQDPERNDYFEYLQDPVMRFVPVPSSNCGHDRSLWNQPLDSVTIRQLMLTDPPLPRE